MGLTRWMPDAARSRLTGGLSRRGFLGVTGAAGSAAIAAAVSSGPAGTPAAQAAPAQHEAMVLRLAAAGSVFPLRLPGYDQAGSQQTRAFWRRLRLAQRRGRGGDLRFGDLHPPSLAVLRSAERRMDTRQRGLARAGVMALVSKGLLGTGRTGVLEGVGQAASKASPAELDELVAAVTLAIATVFPSFDGSSDLPARQSPE